MGRFFGFGLALVRSEEITPKSCIKCISIFAYQWIPPLTTHPPPATPHFPPPSLSLSLSLLNSIIQYSFSDLYNHPTMCHQFSSITLILHSPNNIPSFSLLLYFLSSSSSSSITLVEREIHTQYDEHDPKCRTEPDCLENITFL